MQGDSYSEDEEHTCGYVVITRMVAITIMIADTVTVTVAVASTAKAATIVMVTYASMNVPDFPGNCLWQRGVRDLFISHAELAGANHFVAGPSSCLLVTRPRCATKACQRPTAIIIVAHLINLTIGACACASPASGARICLKRITVCRWCI